MPSIGVCAPESEECIRSEPAPVFDAKQPAIRSHQFVPVSNHEAREYVVLASGESLEIHHGGCEYFVTTFRFQSRYILKDIKSRPATYTAAATLLRRLQQLNEKSGFDLALAAKTLETAARRNSAIEFEEQLAVEGDGTDFLQTQVQVDAAGEVSGKGFVQISLFKGPL